MKNLKSVTALIYEFYLYIYITKSAGTYREVCTFLADSSLVTWRHELIAIVSSH